MIHSRELRIGSYTYYNEQVICISVANILEIVGYETLKPNELNPYKFIPLTEEWLVRLGFKSNLIPYSLEYKIAGTDFILREIRDSSGEQDWMDCEVIGYDFIGAWEKFAFVKYVHQLQNLYFALTGEELIK